MSKLSKELEYDPRFFIPAGEFTVKQAILEYEDFKRILSDPVALPYIAQYSAYTSGMPNAPDVLFRILTALHAVAERSEVVLWNGRLFHTAVHGCTEAFKDVEIEEMDCPLRPELWVTDIDIKPSDETLRALGLPTTMVTGSTLIVPLSDFLDALFRAGFRMSDAQTFLLNHGIDNPKGHGWVRVTSFVRSMEGLSDPFKQVTHVEVIPRILIDGYAQLGSKVRYDAVAESMAARAFMREKIVEVSRNEPTADQVKWHQKRKRPIPPTVDIVRLRKLVRPQEGASLHPAHGGYSCHWIVEPHWRRPNKRMKEQRPIFVNDYVKGDLNKPFKPKASLTVVNR